MSNVKKNSDSLATATELLTAINFLKIFEKIPAIHDLDLSNPESVKSSMQKIANILQKEHRVEIDHWINK